jgi:hypothetical protein
MNRVDQILSGKDPRAEVFGESWSGLSFNDWMEMPSVASVYCEAAAGSLAHLISISGKGRSYGIITAFQLRPPGSSVNSTPEEILEINLARNRRLERDIIQAGFGYIKVHGFYTYEKENPKTGKTERMPTEEDSFVISLPKSNPAADTELKEFLGHMVRNYNQESALIKPSDSERQAYLIMPDDRMVGIGEVTPEKYADYYTAMKKGPRSRLFPTKGRVFTTVTKESYKITLKKGPKGRGLAFKNPPPTSDGIVEGSYTTAFVYIKPSQAIREGLLVKYEELRRRKVI